MPNTLRNAYLKLHLAIFLWGFTAILGKLISLSGLFLVWWRLVITSTAMFLLPETRLELRRLPVLSVLKLAGIGCLVMAHWVCFYSSIKAANASIALSCLATTSFLAAILEPIFTRKKIQRNEILFGLLVVPGMYFIFEFGSERFFDGIIWGLFAALFAALFSTLNKTMVDKVGIYAISFIELSSGLVLLTGILVVFFRHTPDMFFPTSADWLYLLVLSLVCTAFTFVISLQAMRHISAFTANLSLNLEPVYGILLAWAILGENKELGAYFYIGVLIILSAVFIHPFLQKNS